ncbi:hypothetical protein CEUSTIGMA_g6724.t1 [Chlamydomonas eustigma]|uniref:Phosphate transporter n=1 Tax=Chlamydomonas eustigma TaxID=1157962 RepID=A0A250X876_9CHLO|nr:hypothetical protein CEUSTIGMA_g6724.t1 [Chlamydomonas eustigma]|eukprot:GAX79284.1 hypothetical protein CEUSTIGMA_g6724.t1 [Chlamydomonas eustigma]
MEPLTEHPGPWTTYEWIVVLGGMICLASSWSIGANYVANAFGTSVGAKTLKLWQACLVAGMFEFAGAMSLGAAVVSTVETSIADVSVFTDQPEFYMYGMLCSMASAGIWVTTATYLELAVSTTHSVVGAILGFTFVYSGYSGVLWATPTVDFPFYKGMVPIVISWFTSPVIAGFVAAMFFLFNRAFILRKQNSTQLAFFSLPFLVLIAIFVDLFFVLSRGAHISWSYQDCAWVAAAAAAGAALLSAFTVLPLLMRRFRHNMDKKRSITSRSSLKLSPHRRASLFATTSECKDVHAQAADIVVDMTKHRLWPDPLLLKESAMELGSRPSMTYSSNSAGLNDPEQLAVIREEGGASRVWDDYVSDPNSCSERKEKSQVYDTSQPGAVSLMEAVVPAADLMEAVVPAADLIESVVPAADSVSASAKSVSSAEVAFRSCAAASEMTQLVNAEVDDTTAVYAAFIASESGKEAMASIPLGLKSAVSNNLVKPGNYKAEAVSDACRMCVGLEGEMKKTGEVMEVDTAQISHGESKLDDGVAVMVGVWENALGDQGDDDSSDPLHSTHHGGKGKMKELREQLKGKLSMAKEAFLHGVRQDIFEDIQHDQRVTAMHQAAELFDPETEMVYKYLQVLSACCVSFAHGSNGIANSVGPYSGIWHVYRTWTLSTASTERCPYWILAIGGFGIVIGLWTYGYNIIRALGVKMVKITPSRGFCAELAVAFTITIASAFGLPISTTHCIVGAEIGVGMCEDLSKGTNWRLFFKIATSWVCTIIITTLLCATLFSQGAYAPSIIMANQINSFEDTLAVATATNCNLLIDNILYMNKTLGRYDSALASQVMDLQAFLSYIMNTSANGVIETGSMIQVFKQSQSLIRNHAVVAVGYNTSGPVYNLTETIIPVL